MKFQKYFRLILGMLLATYFMSLIFEKVNLNQIENITVKIKWPWLIMSLLMLSMAYSFRVQRWRLMLKLDNPSISWGDCSGPLFASYAINNVLPFRLGDIARAYTFKNRLGVDPVRVIATLLVERLFDLLIILCILLATIYILHKKTICVFSVEILASLILVTAILLILNLPCLFFAVLNYFAQFVAKIFPRIGVSLINFLNNIFCVLEGISKSGLMTVLTLWSIIIWIAEGCVFWFVAIGLPGISDSSASWIALSVGTLANLIPSTPGSVGTFDYFVIQSMQSLGNGAAESTAYAFIVHALLWFPLTVIGGVYLLIILVDLKKLKVIK